MNLHNTDYSPQPNSRFNSDAKRAAPLLVRRPIFSIAALNKMTPITKHNLPVFVQYALVTAGLRSSSVPDLALKILQSGAIEFPKPVAPQRDRMEMIVIGRRSRSAVRAAGNLVNVFTLAAVIQSAATAAGVTALASPILIGVLGACSTTLSPKQAAFFVAASSLRDSDTIPTASAIASACSKILPGLSVSTDEVLIVADELLKMGVPISIGDPPNWIIRHSEWTLTVPGF